MKEKCGMILINKDSEMTSHDCVNIVRRSFNMKRVGHTGTLDPMATGLLPVCIGKATKLADFIGDYPKEYRAGILFGMTTDTLDITGEVLSQNEFNSSKEEIAAAINSFLGESMQIPPMYSAKKINGKKLYELAREGKEAERKPCRIEISKIDIEEINTLKKTARILVKCSKGTYIRSLIDDIGKNLGCGAVMTSLQRTACGGFSIDDDRVCSISELKEMPDKAAEKIISAIIRRCLTKHRLRRFSEII